MRERGRCFSGTSPLPCPGADGVIPGSHRRGGSWSLADTWRRRCEGFQPGPKDGFSDSTELIPCSAPPLPRVRGEPGWRQTQGRVLCGSAGPQQGHGFQGACATLSLGATDVPGTNLLGSLSGRGGVVGNILLSSRSLSGAPASVVTTESAPGSGASSSRASGGTTSLWPGQVVTRTPFGLSPAAPPGAAQCRLSEVLSSRTSAAQGSAGGLGPQGVCLRLCQCP